MNKNTLPAALIPLLMLAVVAGFTMCGIGLLALYVDVQTGLFLLVDGGAMTALVIALLAHWLRRRA